MDKVPHGTPSGYSYWKCRCEVCVTAKREKDRAYYAANADTVKAKVAKYRRENPDVERERDRKYREENAQAIREQKRAYSIANAEKEREQQRQWRLRNPDRVRQNQRAWKEANREKVRALNREYMRRRAESDPEGVRANRRRWYKTERGLAYRQLSNARRRGVKPNDDALEWAVILRRDPCCFCGSLDKVEIDHIVAVSAGGGGEWDNLSAACRSCNARKNDRPLLEFLRRSMPNFL